MGNRAWGARALGIFFLASLLVAACGQQQQRTQKVVDDADNTPAPSFDTSSFDPDDSTALLGDSNLSQDGGINAAIEALKGIPAENQDQAQLFQDAGSGLMNFRDALLSVGGLTSESSASALQSRFQGLNSQLALIAQRLEQQRYFELAAVFWDLSNKVPVYRFKHPSRGHNFASDLIEVSKLINNEKWKFEGIAFRLHKETSGWAPQALFRCTAVEKIGTLVIKVSVYGKEATCGAKGTSGVRLGYIAAQPNRFFDQKLHHLKHPNANRKREFLTASETEFKTLTTPPKGKWKDLGVLGHVSY